MAIWRDLVVGVVVVVGSSQFASLNKYCAIPKAGAPGAPAREGKGHRWVTIRQRSQ
jgi:hypothetical protein